MTKDWDVVDLQAERGAGHHAPSNKEIDFYAKPVDKSKMPFKERLCEGKAGYVLWHLGYGFCCLLMFIYFALKDITLGILNVLMGRVVEVPGVEGAGNIASLPEARKSDRQMDIELKAKLAMQQDDNRAQNAMRLEITRQAGREALEKQRGKNRY